MKTAILQCLQEFSSKNSKNVYHEQIVKKVKITPLFQNCTKRLCFPLNITFYENCSFAVFAGAFQ